MNFFSFNFPLRGMAKVNSLSAPGVQIVGTARRDVSKKQKGGKGEGRQSCYCIIRYDLVT